MKFVQINKIFNIERRSLRRQELFRKIKRDKFLYILLIPGILYFFIFRFLPMGGLIIAFKDFQPFLGFKATLT